MKHTGRPLSVVVTENESAVRNILIDGNPCSYQKIQNEVNIGSEDVMKFMH